MKQVLLCGCLSILLCLAAVFCGCLPIDTGSLSVRVLDGWDDRPIANARVVIPETGDVCITDAEGRTSTFSVPILYDRHFANILPQDWGTATVLVYAEGYYTCMLYGVCIGKNEVRDNLAIRLFPGDGSMGETPFLLAESPDSGWVAEMMRRYGP